MKVLDSTINEKVTESEKRGDWILVLALLELKQFRLEKRFSGMMAIGVDESSKKYLESKIKFK